MISLGCSYSDPCVCPTLSCLCLLLRVPDPLATGIVPSLFDPSHTSPCFLQPFETTYFSGHYDPCPIKTAKLSQQLVHNICLGFEPNVPVSLCGSALSLEHSCRPFWPLVPKGQACAFLPLQNLSHLAQSWTQTMCSVFEEGRKMRKKDLLVPKITSIVNKDFLINCTKILVTRRCWDWGSMCVCVCVCVCVCEMHTVWGLQVLPMLSVSYQSLMSLQGLRVQLTHLTSSQPLPT